MSDFSSGMDDAMSAWSNQRLALELGYGFSDPRPSSVRDSSAQGGRAALLGAMRMKDSAQIVGTVAMETRAPESPWGYSLAWLTQGIVADMVDATTTMMLSGQGPAPAPETDDGSLRPGNHPMPGERIDVQG